MKIQWYALPAAALFLGACDTTSSDPERFEADLSGGAQVPVRTAPATGAARFTLSPTAA